MFDTNFFRDVLPMLVDHVPEGHTLWLSLKLRNEPEVHWPQRVVYVGGGYVCFELSAPDDQHRFLAVQFDSIEYLMVTGAAPEQAPAGEGSGFTVDPTTAN